MTTGMTADGLTPDEDTKHDEVELTADGDCECELVGFALTGVITREVPLPPTHGPDPPQRSALGSGGLQAIRSILRTAAHTLSARVHA